MRKIAKCLICKFGKERNINCFPLVVFFRKKFSRAESCAESEVTRNPCRFNFSIQSVTVTTSLPSALRRCFSLRHLKGEYLWYTTEKVP